MSDAAPIWMDKTGALRGAGALSLDVQNLACARGGRTLFTGLSFSASPGAAVEIRGPNGAGKTTLLRAIAGLLRPSSGKVSLRISDSDAEPDNARGLGMHFVGLETAARPEETVRQSLLHWAAMWSAKPEAARDAADRLGLASKAERAVRRLSSGERKRLGLARLLLQDRPIWLLDEPNTGLDAAGRALCYKLITEHRAKGGIVIVATHDAANLEGAAMIRLNPGEALTA